MSMTPSSWLSPALARSDEPYSVVAAATSVPESVLDLPASCLTFPYPDSTVFSYRPTFPVTRLSPFLRRLRAMSDPVTRLSPFLRRLRAMSDLVLGIFTEISRLGGRMPAVALVGQPRHRGASAPAVRVSAGHYPAGGLPDSALAGRAVSLGRWAC